MLITLVCGLMLQVCSLPSILAIVKSAIDHHRLVPRATYRIKTGDTLSRLSLKYYGSKCYWLIIWETNRATIGQDPNRLSAGRVLTIPQLSIFPVDEQEKALQLCETWRHYRTEPR
jgi:hypothetical protein